MPRKPKTAFTTKEKRKIAKEIEQFRRKEYLFRLFEEGLESKSSKQKEASLAYLTFLYFVDEKKAVDLLYKHMPKFKGDRNLAFLADKKREQMLPGSENYQSNKE